jgi:hypothetical protein
MIPIFAFMALRPVMPVVTDLFAHTFYFQTHIHHAHNHQNNHVLVEIQKIHERSDQQQSKLIQWSIEKWQFISYNFEKLPGTNIMASQRDPIFQAITIDDNYSFSIDHPPKIRLNS